MCRGGVLLQLQCRLLPKKLPINVSVLQMTIAHLHFNFAFFAFIIIIIIISLMRHFVIVLYLAEMLTSSLILVLFFMCKKTFDLFYFSVTLHTVHSMQPAFSFYT